VDARPTREQRELEAAATRLAERLGVGAVGDLDDDDRRTRLDAAVVQAGWRELRTGGREPLASGVEAALVTRALARRVCDVAFVGPVLAHDLLRRAGVDDTSTRTVAVGADLGALARGSGVAVDAGGCTDALALAPEAAAGALRVIALPIDASDDGGTGVDLTRRTCPVTAPSGAPALGAIGDDELLAWEALATVLTAADLVGVTEGALELATGYARQRCQFGAPIGSFQAVQHLLADAKTLAEGSLSALLYASWAVDALEPAAARAAAAVAKAYAVRAARTVCEMAIQVHGGIGNTWECMAHVFLRRALVSSELFGDDGAQLALLARQRWGAAHGLR
jgi:hypothetical protein